MEFRAAKRGTSKLRMAVDGPSGSGKTFTALRIASAIGGKIAVIDTEHGSASKYAGVKNPDTGVPFEFDVLELSPPFSPERYCEAIAAAEDGGYNVTIIDSASHEWNGNGGILNIVDDETARAQSRLSAIGWKKATPRHDKFVDAIIRCKTHIIVTMRAKQEYAVEKDEKTGKASVRKLGMAPIQRDQFEYEFDVFADMDLEHTMVISKTRCAELDGKLFHKPGKDVADVLVGWLSGAPSGGVPEPQKEEPKSGNILVSNDDLKGLGKFCSQNGLSKSDVLKITSEMFENKTPRELTVGEFDKLMRVLNDQEAVAS